jgi:U4/U6 small nuclear ribonucleoprotein PRP3
MRKQRRQAELQDKRDRIRMGLIPPDAPKVRLANLMKVLTSDAVQDPTRVEARVRREVAMRKHGHDKMNAERKLTDEQRREKVENKKLEEEKKGIFGSVFKCVSRFVFSCIMHDLTVSVLGSGLSLIPRTDSRYGRTRNK